MDSLENPDQFENSSIVEKSSNTGIFSNKRLLVIKNGYLYYFSKVPKGYKSHVPNILTTFTDLPKSSIEIKNIIDIRLESTKSSNLIIKFYLRDMIDREFIRKSIDTHSYMLPQKKGNNDTDEWKFSFTTVLQCRLWFNALIKLKDYFKNLDIKFEKFVSNFDKRNSVVIDSSKEARSQSELKLPINPNTLSEKSELSRKTETIAFDASKFIGSIPEKQLSPINNKVNIEEKFNETVKIHIEETKEDNNLIESKIISEEDENSENGYHPNISHKIEPEIPVLPVEPMKKVEPFKSASKESHLIEPINEDEEIKIRQLEEEIREELKEEVEKTIREEVESKLKEKLEKEKKEEITKFKAEVELKEMKIKQLETEIHIKHLANMEKQKLIEEEKKELQNKIYQEQEKLKQYKITVENQQKEQEKIKNSLINAQKENQKQATEEKNQSNTKIMLENYNKKKWIEAGDEYSLEEHSENLENETQKYHEHNDKTKPSIIAEQNPIEVHEFSVQTDDEEFQHNHSYEFEHHFNFSKEISISKDLNLSKETKIRNSFFSDNLPSHRNTLLSERFRIEEDILPSDEQQEKEEFSKFNYFFELERIFENGISSTEKIEREIKLLRYVNFIKSQIVKISHDYIEKNHPTECVSFEKGFLSFELACAPGKIMNIGGEKKLIYSNKTHENLKRTFKIYQKIQTEIMKLIKSKKSFPVRVPLCTLIEYRGYTILGKVEICCDEEDSLEKDKYLKYFLPSVFHSSVQLSKTIQIDDENQYFMVKVLKPFKLTNEQKSSQLFAQNNIFNLCETEIMKCRSSSVSICYEKLSKEINERNDEDGEIKTKDQESTKDQKYLLRLIKLMRELKKVFKSIEPFGKNLQKESQINSEFMHLLLKKPEEILGLIPADIEFKVEDLQCGYFWSLLEFFLGIRMNDPVKEDIENPSYKFVPFIRTFHFESLLCNQYCEKIDKYLWLNNVDSAENCYRLLKKISSNEFHALLTEIKILLKKKSYDRAEEKIHYLRESLPLHDLKNIEINAYLIECYIFMGLETEALKEIKSSLEYVEYLFGERKNVYEENLHLLMAETLLKMGNIKEAIKLYKSLLKYDKINKEEIIVSFAENLTQDYRFDSNETIPFLLECIEEIQSADKKIDLFLCIGKLYLRCERKDKCIFYLQKAYEFGMSSKSYQQTLTVYEKLINTLPSESKKQSLYLNFTKQVENKFFSNPQNCRYFNTINLYQLIVEKEDSVNMSVIVELLEEIKDQTSNELMVHLELKDWESLSSCSKILSSLDPTEIESNLKSLKKTLESVDIEKLLQWLKQNQKIYTEI